MSEREPSAAERRLLHGLRRRKERERSGLFLAEGVRVVESLLGSTLDPRFAVVASSLKDTQRGDALWHALADRCALRVVSEAELARLADTEAPQGVVVAVETPRVDADRLPLEERGSILVLDAVQDPGNFGALIRCALAFASPLAIALPGTVDPWNAKAVRAAAGASFHVPIVSLETAAALAWLRARGFALYAADAGGTPLGALNPPPRVALAVGNEGAGLGHALLAAADACVSVVMPGPAESLNVAVAAGILLHALAQRP
jgi:RNA methyltransferase, TrmH family